MSVVKETNTKFEEVMSWPVCQVFYLTCYIIDSNKLKEQQMRNWKNTH